MLPINSVSLKFRKRQRERFRTMNLSLPVVLHGDSCESSLLEVDNRTSIRGYTDSEDV